ncbi:hypothetical protein IAU60_001043 [Kwoniella sp. DSM 27419]
MTVSRMKGGDHGNEETRLKRLLTKVFSRITIGGPFVVGTVLSSVYLHIRSAENNGLQKASLLWTILIICIAAYNRLSRVYCSGRNWIWKPPQLNWRNQVVLITGGATGVGALLAEAVAAKGSIVVVLTKDLPEGKADTDRIRYFACDVSDYGQVRAVAKSVRDEVGHPTIIVNNAGVVKGKLLLDLTEADIADTFGSNTLAHFWVLKAFLPHMLRLGHGHVVTMSSVLGLVGAAQMTDYCASKAALVSLNQCLRFELDNRYSTPGIRTTLVLPSFIKTSLFAQIALPSSPIFRFLCPPLEPDTVVSSILDALNECESRVIRLPMYTNLGRIWGNGPGLIPAWLMDIVQGLAGADHAMRDYGPQPDAAERLAAERQSVRDGGL